MAALVTGNGAVFNKSMLTVCRLVFSDSGRQLSTFLDGDAPVECPRDDALIAAAA